MFIKKSQSLYDWPAFDTLNQCSQNGGDFSEQKDHNGTYICSSLAQGTVGGTVKERDLVGVTVTDDIFKGDRNSAAYKVEPNDTTTNIAAGIAGAINDNPIFKAAGFTATSSDNVFNISSGT